MGTLQPPSPVGGYLFVDSSSVVADPGDDARPCDIGVDASILAHTIFLAFNPAALSLLVDSDGDEDKSEEVETGDDVGTFPLLDQ